MDAVLTIAEIQEKFASEWVLIEGPSTNQALEVCGGTMRCHGKDRERALHLPPPGMTLQEPSTTGAGCLPPTLPANTAGFSTSSRVETSYGAVAALYALIARPDLFDAGLIESPSLAIGNGQLLRDTEHLFKGPARVFLGAGATEFGNDPDGPDNQGYVRTIEALEANFKAAAQGQTRTLTVIQPGAGHGLPAWASRFPQAVEFLFPAWP